ncbi:MAG: hypothetical protein K8F60_09750 [Melioribacteraceae bacterium]|nr:hypothetical protein [Melioribacteraceae bacterium]
MDSNEKLVYLEAHDESSSLTAFDFHDITIMDTKTLKRFYVSYDIFYDREPAISSDGKYIAFLSAREGSKLSLKFQGIGAPKQLYFFDIKTKLLQKEKLSSSGLGSDFKFFNNDSCFIYNLSDEIKTWNRYTKEYKILKKFEDVEIREIILSKSQKLMVIGCFKTIKLWNLLDDKIVDIKVDGGSNIGGFNTNESKFLFKNHKTNKLYEFDIQKMDSTEIVLPNDSRICFPYRDFYFKKDGNIVGFATEVSLPDDDDMIEIVEYDIQKKEYKFLTNDGLQKHSLRYWFE